MSIDKALQKRSNNLCELCGSDEANKVFIVPNSPSNKMDHQLWICSICNVQMENIETAEENHWRCLKECIWSEIPVIKIVSWRMLHKLKNFEWTQDLLEMAYLDETEMEWAKASGDDINQDDIEKHTDCFGAVLLNGDNVVLTKTLCEKVCKIVIYCSIH